MINTWAFNEKGNFLQQPEHDANVYVTDHSKIISTSNTGGSKCCGSVENTDRELYREPDKGNGSFYSDSIFVTKEGGIGMNVGGYVMVRPIKEWHKAMKILAGIILELKDVDVHSGEFKP